MGDDEDIEKIIDLSVIIVSWNVADLLEQCINSIAEYVTKIIYEIIVIDNFSSDYTISMLQQKFPWVKVISNSVNVGFSKANNQGFEIAKGRYILILNPDTQILMNSIQPLIQVLNNQSEVGMVGPKILLANGQIQPECARLLPSLISKILYDVFRIKRIPLLGEWFSKIYFFPYDYCIGQFVEAISGAAMLVRRSLLMDMSGFGERYIFGGEDLDLCYRLSKFKNKRIYYEPQSEIIHYFGQSRIKNHPNTVINGAISQKEYFMQNSGKYHAAIYELIIKIVEVPLIILVGLIKIVLKKETIKCFSSRIQMVKGLLKWQVIP